jgi:hypothetical protein
LAEQAGFKALGYEPGGSDAEDRKVFWMVNDPVEIVTYVSVAFAVFSAAAIAWVVLRGR